MGRGRSLLATEPGISEADRSRALIAEYHYPEQALAVLENRGRGYEERFHRLQPYLRRMRSIRLDGWKLIWGSDGEHALYHVAVDPDEEDDLAEREPERLRELEALLLSSLSDEVGRALETIAEPYSAKGSPMGFEDVENIDEETLEQLKALGYAN